MTELLKPAPGPFELNAAPPVVNVAAITAAVLAAIPAALAADLVTNVTSEAQSIGNASFVMIRRDLTAAEVGTAADVPLLNGQAGKVILPLYGWVHLVTGAVAPSSGRTISIAYAAGGNPLIGRASCRERVFGYV